MISNSVEAWDERAREAGSSWETALWSKQGQEARFNRASFWLPHTQGTLLDYGCGTGRFSEWVKNYDYTGTDSSPEMVRRAGGEHPYKRFVHVDLLGVERYDAVVALGVWNLAETNWRWGALAAIQKLWCERTNKVLIVSLLRRRAEDCIWHDPGEVARFAEKLTDAYVVDCSYLRNDLMVVMWK